MYIMAVQRAAPTAPGCPRPRGPVDDTPPLAGRGHRDNTSWECWEEGVCLGKDPEDPGYSCELQAKYKDRRKTKQEKEEHGTGKARSDKQELPRQEAEGRASAAQPACLCSNGLQGSTWPGPFPNWALPHGRETRGLAPGVVGNLVLPVVLPNASSYSECFLSHSWRGRESCWWNLRLPLSHAQGCQPSGRAWSWRKMSFSSRHPWNTHCDLGTRCWHSGDQTNSAMAPALLFWAWRQETPREVRELLWPPSPQEPGW